MIGVVLLAHGSRHPLADAAIEHVASTLQDVRGWPTRAAHLDFSTDTLPVVVQQLVSEFAALRRVIVVPLLFTQAYHHRVDVPEAIEEARLAVPEVDVVLADSLGLGDDMAAVIAGEFVDLEQGALGGSAHPPVSRAVFAVGSSDAQATQDVHDFAARLGAAAFFATGPAAREGFGPADLRRLAEQGSVFVQPLFVAPATLLEKAIADCMSGASGDVPGDEQVFTNSLRFGEVLGTKLLPILQTRIEREIP